MDQEVSWLQSWQGISQCISTILFHFFLNLEHLCEDPFFQICTKASRTCSNRSASGTGVCWPLITRNEKNAPRKSIMLCELISSIVLLHWFSICIWLLLFIHKLVFTCHGKVCQTFVSFIRCSNISKWMQWAIVPCILHRNHGNVSILDEVVKLAGLPL